MRFKHIKKILSEQIQQLDELKMSPNSLRQFAESPGAQGIRAGFEAELVFTGLGGSNEDDFDSEPDYDYDERPGSIDDVVDFFSNDDYGYGLSREGRSRLRDRLEEAYFEWSDDQMYSAWRDEREDLIKEWILDNEWDWDDSIRNILDEQGYSDDDVDAIMKFEGVKDVQAALDAADDYEAARTNYVAYEEARAEARTNLDALVEATIDDEDGVYDDVLDSFRDNFQVDDDSGFFSDLGLRWMSDIANEYDLTWPYWTEQEGGGQDGDYDYGNAEMLAQSLSKALGVKAKASGGYHSARRDSTTWIFEPDSSLDADESENMPVEIVSPPMPLKDCLVKMEQFFEWVEDNGGYANSSTGFHMGVSMPVTGGKVDYIKLALFLGDEHVLESFGRAGNTYCAAAMKKIRDKIGSKHNNEQVAGAMELMRHNLIELATKQLKIVGAEGFGKYTSINPHLGGDGNGYIEFRSAGGEQYFEDIEKLKNTLLRYAQAMHVASRPDLERNEYYKKLYKLISPTGNTSLDLFAKFATGSISKDELKKQWADTTLSKEVPGHGARGNWKLYKKDGTPVPSGEFHNYSEEDAWAKAAEQFGVSVSNAQGQFELTKMGEPGYWQLVDTETQDVIDTVEATTYREATVKFEDLHGDNPNWSKFEVKRAFELDDQEPKPELSPRAKLAKRIKQAKDVKSYPNQLRDDSGKPMWKVVDNRGLSVWTFGANSQNDAESQYKEYLRDWNRRPEDYKLEPYIQKPKETTPAVQDTPVDVAQNFQQPAPSWPFRVGELPRHDWELYQHETPDQVFHTMRNATTQEVMDYINHQERNGMPPGFLRVRQLG